MNLFNKIKYNYYINLIDDNIKNSNFELINDSLIKVFNANPLLFHQLIKYLFKNISNDQLIDNFFKKQSLFWINSFDFEDQEYIFNFLKFYYAELGLEVKATKYSNFLSEYLFKFEPGKSKIDFNDLIENAYIYQYSMTKLYDDQSIILSNTGAFFENNLKRYFTHYQLSKGFVYVLKNPINIFQKFRTNLGNKNAALNETFNLSAASTITDVSFSNNKFVIEENRQSLLTNIYSWCNFNTLSAFRGKIIKYEDLMINPDSTLAEIIAHFIERGDNIPLSYEVIEKFIQNNPISPIPNNLNQLSNQEKKLIRRELDAFPQCSKILDDFNYKIDL